jgi:pimeloyl-ACP methyl ester carboxylesterase
MTGLKFSRSGAGEPLLLLHGIGDTRAAWTQVIGPLSTRHEVLAVDLPGFGTSPALPEDERPTPQALAQAVAAWLDTQGLERVHIAGSSLGGWVALELAALGRAYTVVGLSPAGFGSDADQRRARQILVLARGMATTLSPAARGSVSPRVRRLLRSGVVRTLTHSSMVARPWRLPPDEATSALEALAAATGWDGTLAALQGVRYAPPAGGMDVPVTLVWGARDRLLPARQRSRALEVLPKARVGVLPGCGHLPMWDDPELVTRVVLTATGHPTRSTS